MKYLFKDKTILISDDIIQKSMKNLGLTKEEAIQVYLEDEGYLDNEEQEELTQKAKENHITSTIHQAREKTNAERKKRTVKPNPTKEMVIARIAEILPEFAENIQVENASKLITFTIGENHYKIDLIQNRKKG